LWASFGKEGRGKKDRRGRWEGKKSARCLPKIDNGDGILHDKSYCGRGELMSN